MTHPVEPGEYRACPFCFEVIRKNAIKCRHCGSEIDPSKLHAYAARARTNPAHIVILVLLLAVTAFVAGYPALERHLDDAALARAMIQKGATVPRAPTPPVVVEAPPEEPAVDTTAVVVSPPGRIEFGEGVELVAGKSYSGETIRDLLEANILGSGTLLESRITVQLGGRSYDVVTGQTAFDPGARYEILSIEESARR